MQCKHPAQEINNAMHGHFAFFDVYIYQCTKGEVTEESTIIQPIHFQIWGVPAEPK